MNRNESLVQDPTRPGLVNIHAWEHRYPGLVAGFTTRLGGQSRPPYDTFNLGLHVGDQPQDVVANRGELARLLDMSFHSFTCGEQTHGTNLYHVQQRDRGKGKDSLQTALPDVDGLYTEQANILLVSFYADCVPLFFFDPAQGLIGLAHAGWKGTVGRIGTKLVKRWAEQFGSQPADIRVVIGPAIGGCCYEVDDRVLDQLRPLQDSFSQHAVRRKGRGHYQLNLKQINLDFLEQAGILAGHIEVSRWCTSCAEHLFYSYRRDKGRTGRMAAFMALKEEAARS